MIRKATEKDIGGIAAVYEAVHDAEEEGKLSIGWERGVYPVRKTAEDALARGDLYVLEEDGKVAATAIINHRQEEDYAKGNWRYPARDEEVLVMHTLAVDPARMSRGLAHRFLAYYVELAKELGCVVVRFDTGEKNKRARSLYGSLGFREADIIKGVEFHGLETDGLVLLEKKLQEDREGQERKDDMFRPMVLEKQQLTEERCIEILKSQKRGILSVHGDDGYPYGVPLNHFYNEEDGKLYFHSAMYGHKVDAIKKDAKVCFTVYEGIGLDEEIPWADNFQSVIIFGKVEIIEDREKLYDIARKLSYRFVDDDAYIQEQIDKDGPITLMFAVCPEHMTGKQVREA